MPPLHIACALLVTLFWGGNYAVVKIGMLTFPPLFYNVLRFALLALLLLPLARRPSRQELKQIAVMSATLCLGHMGLLFTALHNGLNASGAALLIQLGVPFSCLLGALLLNDRLGLWRMGGLALSLAGTVIIMGDPNLLHYPFASALAVVSAFLWALSNIQLKRLAAVDIITLLAWQAAFALPMLLAASLLTEHIDWRRVMSPPPVALAALLYTTLLSSIAAFGMWNWLIRRHDVSRIAPFALVMPFFAVIAGQVLLGEHLSGALFAGGALMLLGVAIITVRRPTWQLLAERI